MKRLIGLIALLGLVLTAGSAFAQGTYSGYGADVDDIATIDTVVDAIQLDVGDASTVLTNQGDIATAIGDSATTVVSFLDSILTDTGTTLDDLVDDLETWLGDPSGGTLTDFESRIGDSADASTDDSILGLLGQPTDADIAGGVEGTLFGHVNDVQTDTTAILADTVTLGTPEAALTDFSGMIGQGDDAAGTAGTAGQTLHAKLREIMLEVDGVDTLLGTPAVDVSADILAIDNFVDDLESSIVLNTFALDGAPPHTTTLIESSALTEGADYWNGVTVVCVDAGGGNSVSRVIDFDDVNDQATLYPALAFTPADADTCSFVIADRMVGQYDDADAGHAAAGTLFGHVNDLQTDSALVLADTNEIQGDWTNGGRLDLILDDVLLDTATTIPGTITTAQASLTALEAEIPNADTWADGDDATLLAATNTLYNALDGDVAEVNRNMGNPQVFVYTDNTLACNGAANVTMATATGGAVIIDSVQVYSVDALGAATNDCAFVVECGEGGNDYTILNYTDPELGTAGIALNSETSATPTYGPWYLDDTATADYCRIRNTAGSDADVQNVRIVVEYRAAEDGGYLN